MSLFQANCWEVVSLTVVEISEKGSFDAIDVINSQFLGLLLYF